VSPGRGPTGERLRATTSAPPADEPPPDAGTREPAYAPSVAVERAISERWIDERAALLAGGPSRVFAARCWMRAIAQPRTSMINPAFLMAELIVDAIQPEPDQMWYAEVALYPTAAAVGALPTAIVPFPVEVGVAVQARAQLAVRGELGPGRGLVAVLPDGTPVGCAGPAQPAPAFRRRRVRLR
jgi:hypothetical protein